MRIAFTLMLALALTGCGEMDVPPSHGTDDSDAGVGMDASSTSDAGQEQTDAGSADSGVPACQPEGYYCTGGRTCCDGLRCDFKGPSLTCVR